MLDEKAVDRAALNEALVMQDADLDAYLTGTPIPVLRQICLAQFVIERVPAFARSGHRLRAQLASTVAYETGQTATHPNPPPSHFWS